MNMVMEYDFNRDFNKKSEEKNIINAELNKIANLASKNQKHNIMLSNAQALRMLHAKTEQNKKN